MITKHKPTLFARQYLLTKNIENTWMKNGELIYLVVRLMRNPFIAVLTITTFGTLKTIKQPDSIISN